MIPSRFHAPLIVAAAACTLLVNLGGPALWDDDEPKNAACSLAMLDSGDWVVPTFNGRLRVEKPPLVNWVQLAGFAVCGRNETGARLGSALLTIGTCLLTWRIGRRLFDAATGLLAGLAMATCLWTAVGGRAATPDAPLAFCTTLGLWLFARSMRPEGLSAAGAAAIGAACGLATLAKGPVGLVLPAGAFVLFAGWRAVSGDARSWRAALTDLRLPTIFTTAAAVALPWYAGVTAATGGEWLQGFFLVHNVGRFAAPMEGHAGSVLYYPGVIAIGLFPWSIVLLAMIVHAAAVLRHRPVGTRRTGVALLACWCLAWIGAFTCSGTKLPGYVWPAYPALALCTAVFFVDWARGATLFGVAPHGLGHARVLQRSTRVMQVAWAALAAGGAAIAVGLPIGAAIASPGDEWLGVLGLVPIAGAVVAWRHDAAGRPHRAIAALAIVSCLLVTLLAAVAADRFSRAQGVRESVAELAATGPGPWACFWNVPPSIVFYAGTTVAKLDTPADVTRHLTAHPQARLVIDSRHEPLVREAFPAGCTVLARIPTFEDRHYLVVGPPPATGALALLP
ncbi:MAG: glycosyltransferase family 39 protein [Planctomycetia bacterium]|nr:glycosyltransferase family 39 protein [Planctomycetia bacterium]